MRMTRDEWTERVRLYAIDARNKEMAKRVAQAIKRPDSSTKPQFKVTERYAFGYTDPRGIYGSTE